MKSEINRYVITGPMRGGKSALIKGISSEIQIYTMAEVAQYLLDKGYNDKKDPLEFQKQVFKTQLEWEDGIDKNCVCGRAVLDRSLIDGLAYLRRDKMNGLKGIDSLFSEIINKAKEMKYAQIFMCEFLKNPEGSDKSREDLRDNKEIEGLIWDAYRSLGYRPIFVPDTYIEKRVELVLNYIQ